MDTKEKFKEEFEKTCKEVHNRQRCNGRKSTEILYCNERLGDVNLTSLFL